jgi:hypothetical protein
LPLTQIINLVPRRSTRKLIAFLPKTPYDNQIDISTILTTWNLIEFKENPTLENLKSRIRKQSRMPLSYHNTTNSTNASGPVNIRSIQNSPENELLRNKTTISISKHIQRRCWKTL